MICSQKLDTLTSLLLHASKVVTNSISLFPTKYKNDSNFIGGVIDYVFEGKNILGNSDVTKYGNEILKLIGRYDSKQNKPIPLVRY